MDTFEIDRDHCGPMVLDALVKINDEIDPIAGVQAILPRRGLRLLRHEHRWNKYFGLSHADGQPQERD